MIGKNLWEDLEIDSLHFESELKFAAQNLITEYGIKLTDTDILRLKALKDSQSDPVQRVIAIYALEYYLQTDYAPVTTNYVFNKRPWWKKIFS